MIVYVESDWGILFGGAPITIFTPMREIVATGMKQASRERMMLIDISDYVFEAMISTRYERVTVYIGKDWISDGQVAGPLDQEAFENFSRYVALRKRQEGRTRKHWEERSDRILTRNRAERDREQEVQAIYDASLVLYQEQQEKQGVYPAAGEIIGSDDSQHMDEDVLHSTNTDLPALPGNERARNSPIDLESPEENTNSKFSKTFGDIDGKPEISVRKDKNGGRWFLGIIALAGFVVFLFLRTRKK